jgi:hypothetical protein
MRKTFLFGFVLCALSFACDKGAGGGATGSTSATAASAAPAATAAAAADVDCEKVVEKIASLNPPDSRGEPEKKLWRSMCAQMKPAEKTCVMGAKAMPDMQACMKK